MKQFAVYIMASRRNGTLYTGLTSSLSRRVFAHREGLMAGFTKKYGIRTLVWYEMHDDKQAAYERETRIKTMFGRTVGRTLGQTLYMGGGNTWCHCLGNAPPNCGQHVTATTETIWTAAVGFPHAFGPVERGGLWQALRDGTGQSSTSS